MNPKISEAAIRCLDDGAYTLMHMYTNTALLLNACHVTSTTYSARQDNFRLSTLQNVAPQYRLPGEPDLAYTRQELPEKYETDVVQRICEDFIIRLVSLLDGIFEDLLEAIAPLNEPGITDADIGKRVRSAWQIEPNEQVKLVNYLLEIGLKPPAGKTSTIEMVFDRYCEMREIRHALVHTGGTLSEKQLQRLKALSNRLPSESRGGSLAHAGFIKDGRVKLTCSPRIVQN